MFFFSLTEKPCHQCMTERMGIADLCLNLQLVCRNESRMVCKICWDLITQVL